MSQQVEYGWMQRLRKAVAWAGSVTSSDRERVALQLHPDVDVEDEALRALIRACLRELDTGREAVHHAQDDLKATVDEPTIVKVGPRHGDRYYVSCPECCWNRYITGKGKAGKAYGGHRKIHRDPAHSDETGEGQ